MEAATVTEEEQAEKTVHGSDFPYKFEIVALEKMFVDESYQRPLTNFVDKVEKEYDPALVGTLVLSARPDGRAADGIRYAVVDGQTRMEGMRRRGVESAPAVVFFNMSKAQEAQLFAKLQKERRGMTSFHRFRAELAANDPTAKAINRITTECGYEIGIDDKSKMISAVAGLENVFKRSPELLERTLLVFREAWQDKHMPTGEVLRGMGYFLDTEDNIDDARLARKLFIVSPEEIARRASALREGAGGSGSVRYMAGAIEGVYRRRGA